MSEVKPWMRRAAESLRDCACTEDDIAEAIAAHAPPVEEMVGAMRDPALNVHDGYRKALDIYDSWLAR